MRNHRPRGLSPEWTSNRYTSMFSFYTKDGTVSRMSVRLTLLNMNLSTVSHGNTFNTVNTFNTFNTSNCVTITQQSVQTDLFIDINDETMIEWQPTTDASLSKPAVLLIRLSWRNMTDVAWTWCSCCIYRCVGKGLIHTTFPDSVLM